MTLLEFMSLFDEFRAPSWDGWKGVLARLTARVREFWFIGGRGIGKSRIVALIACWFASIREYRRAPGEFIYVGIFSPDRKQSAITFRYVLGLLRSVPALEALIVNVTRDSIELSNGVVIEVLTASIAAPRGRAYALAIVEEAPFLPTDESANPDVELLRAIRPALARVPNSLLAVIGSPYARRGITWDAEKKYGDGRMVDDVVYVREPTLALNPTFDAAAIAKAYEDDPVSAAAEYGAEFRRDVESYVSVEAVEAVIAPGVLELPPGLTAEAATDMAGGEGKDSGTLAIAGRDGDGRAVLLHVSEVRPPFDPDEVTRQFAATLKRYRCFSVIGDAWAKGWPAARFAEQGITYRTADKVRSDIYAAFLPLVTSRRVQLLDLPRLKAQLLGLERRTGRSGKDAIDHGPNGHDDVCNAVALALVEASTNSAAIGAPVGMRKDEDEDGDTEYVGNVRPDPGGFLGADSRERKKGFGGLKW